MSMPGLSFYWKIIFAHSDRTCSLENFGDFHSLKTLKDRECFRKYLVIPTWFQRAVRPTY